jgi:cytochrome c peroxidase
VSARSRFDQAFTPAGPVFEGVLTPLEQIGRVIFSSQRCSSCHTTNAHVSDNVHNTGLDAVTTDLGAGRGRFKAPSLRNVAVRAPYMHDGRFATLEEVIDFYSAGIQPNPDLSDRLQGATGPVRFNFTAEQKAGLAAFLRALTDSAFITSPRFSNPFPM